MLNWTARDWVGVVIGWFCGGLMFLLIPESPGKLILVFVAGFVGAFFARGVIPR